MTLQQVLANEKDGDLLDMYEEISSGRVPATSYTQQYRRKLNKMIDNGELCISTTSYRKVYLPTFAKAVLAEMAKRYAAHVKFGI